MMKLSPIVISLLQSTGLVFYILLIAALINQSQLETIRDPFLAFSLFVLLFVVSALISASLILGYPLWLFFNNKKGEAVKLVILSTVWLLFFLTVSLAFLLSFRK